MAQDATGPVTTGDSLPTYLTSADAPSGKGFNATIAAIQTALNARVSKPSGIVSGEVPVWNGTAFDRSSVTRVGAGSIGSGTPGAATYLRGNSTWGGIAPYKKNSQKTIVNTVANTDMLNGEFTITAGDMPAISTMRFRAWGVMSNAVGANQNALRWSLGFGGTTVFDTNTSGVTVIGTGGGALPWEWEITVSNTGATNAQIVTARYWQSCVAGTVTAWLPTVSGVTIANLAAGGYLFILGQYQAASTIDFSTSKAMTLNLIQPVASANFTTILYGASAEIL